MIERILLWLVRFLFKLVSFIVRSVWDIAWYALREAANVHTPRKYVVWWNR